MKNTVAAFVVGFIFALGLGISGMTQPQKVIGFLDIFGAWDPSLLFVMIGAIGVHFIAYKIIRKRTSPKFASSWEVPDRKDVTPSLIIGSLLFGIGWGLGGYCPGPALVSTANLDVRPLIFVIAMISGMLIFAAVNKKWKFKK